MYNDCMLDFTLLRLKLNLPQTFLALKRHSFSLSWHQLIVCRCNYSCDWFVALFVAFVISQSRLKSPFSPWSAPKTRPDTYLVTNRDLWRRDWCSTSKITRGTQRQCSENICPEDDLRSRIFGTFVVKFLSCLPLLGFSNV